MTWKWVAPLAAVDGGAISAPTTWTDEWSRSDVLAAGAIIVTTIAVIVGAIAARRWGTRRAKILFEYQCTRLLPIDNGNSQNNLIKVTYRDTVVPDPHITSVRIQNIGPRDVSSSDFDGGNNLRINLNCVMYGILGTSDQIHSSDVLSSTVGDPGFVEISPRLLKKGGVWEVEVITQGESKPEIKEYLIQTDVVSGESRSTTVMNELISSALRSAIPFGSLVGKLLR